MSNHQLATAVPCPNVDLPESAREPVVQSIRTSKIRSQHRERVAIVYVRQSTPQQVIEHQESRLRQYDLAAHAVALGWSQQRVLVIDEDQGLQRKERRTPRQRGCHDAAIVAQGTNQRMFIQERERLLSGGLSLDHRATAERAGSHPRLIVFDGTRSAFDLTVNWLDICGFRAPDEMHVCPDGKFEMSIPIALVFSFDVFVHFDFQLMRAYFQSVAAALRSGGRFLVSLASDFSPPPTGWVRSEEWFNYAVHVTGQGQDRSIALDDQIKKVVEQHFVCDISRSHLVPAGFGQVLFCLRRK